MDDKALPESKDSLDAVTQATNATPRRMKAPPKGPPPEAKDDGGDAKGDDGAGGEKKKKKALPPPSNPPPQGATSAAAAFRAKSSLPPPNGPPPSGATSSASVAKIRGAARPPSGTPPPSGAKPVGTPPSGPPPKTMASPSAAPKNDSKSIKDEDDDGAKPMTEAKKLARPPSASASASSSSPAVADNKPKRTTAAPPSAKAIAPKAPVDLLGDESPIIDDAIASAPVSASVVVEKPAPTIKLSQASVNLMRASIPSSGPASSSASVSSAPVSKPPVVKKSTLDVLNDTSASLNRGGRNAMADDPESKRTSGLADVDRPSTAAATGTTGRAVPFSGSSRPNVPEEEVILVKKQEYKRDETGAGIKELKDLEDSIEDLEEIPFLDETKSDPKANDKTDARRSVAHTQDDDDPEIVIENKSAASNKSKATAEAKQHAEHKVSNNDEKDHDDALLDRVAAKETDKDDVYNELRKLKRNSITDEDGTTDADGRLSGSASQTDHESKRERGSVDGHDDESKDGGDGGSSSSRERRERRREKRRHKREEEPKKIQPQFYNPKSVPFMPEHLLDFVKRPLECGRGHIIKCFIERNDQNKLAPVFTLLLEVDNISGRPIMYAKKKGTSRITSHYVISLNKEDLNLPRMMRSHQYIGKLRSSTSLMDYCLYDQGDNPEDLDSDCEVDDEMRKSVRAELAVIRYHHNKKAYARKMEVAIPAIVDSGASYLDWRPISRDQMMEEHVRAITAAGGQNVLDTQNFTFMHKRETKYDALSSCIVDFRSRATCTSVKNFQLVHSEPTSEEMKEKYRKLHPDYVYEDQGTVSLPQEHVLLQLGKVGKYCFNMDFQYPLSMLQAFAICLSRFDSKQR